MRTWADRLVTRAKVCGGLDEGFTLVEMVVGLIVFALAAQALAGVLIGSARSQLSTQKNTGAKNFTQEQIDAMRSLPYHVAAQNGPFIDLLDLYYPNASSSTTLISHVIENQKVPGVYVASSPKTAIHPAGPYYQDTIAGSLISSQLAAFTMVIYTQFLDPSRVTGTALAPTTGYDSLTPGSDSPASPLVGITIDTSWSSNGTTHTLTTFTEIASQGTDTPLVVNEAKATAARILTQDDNLNAITATVGSASSSGSVSNGSQAGAQAIGASVDYTTYTTPGDPTTATDVELAGAQASAVSPPNPAGSTGLVASSSSQAVSGSSCGSEGWASFGPTQVSDVSSTTALSTQPGVPIAPSDARGNPSDPFVTSVLDSTGGQPCSGLWFSNETDALHEADGSWLDGSKAMVRLADLPGNGPEVTGATRIYASSPGGVDGAVTATATTSMATSLNVFPGATLQPALPTSAPGVIGNPGLINVQLTSAKLSCSSAAGGTTAVTLTYSGQIVYYAYLGSGRYTWKSVPFDQSSGDVSSSVPLSQPIDANGKKLSDYITSVTSATGVSTSSGVQSVEAVISITTVPTLGVGYAGTSLDIELGHLSCVAQDNR